jgi:hypothetical protein
MIIGISGKIGSGKDLVGQIMQVLLCDAPDYINTDSMNDIKSVLNWLNSIENTPWEEMMFPDHKIAKNFLSKHKTVEIKKFAGKLKEIAAILIGCDISDFEDREFKETELGEEWTKYRIITKGLPNYYVSTLQEAEDNVRNSNQRYVKVMMTPRLMLQLLGTEAGRDIIHPNIWVNALFASYLKDSNWVVTDVRFPNEAQAIKDRGGIVIRVDKPQLIERDFEHLSETSLDNYEFDHVIDNNGSIEELIEKVKKLNII